ncbi:MAG TPA: prepilin-type N-terminal cleavage/methylation domain-containing protein [Candidatus Spyradenecus faecavium]|uniref:Prepilin-type N-terminal cleavage/methylation domain-containing protein n=1 Tax=Candidatus Spyradenecus faecavium TaxID=2840947 RepID=A0A9D1NKV3_9BACT|nr:prepilin-type N-terminal cleavage/methylation domain-containing protein [Candidatus Spyradenecus faecavium]
MNLWTQAKRGFTLIELLVVIVIVGILTSAAMMAYGGFIERAHQKNAAEMCAQIATAWTRYYADMGFWPNALSSSSVQEMDTEMCTILGKAKLLDVNYIDSSNTGDAASGLRRNKDDDPQLKFGLLDTFGLRMFEDGFSESEIKKHLYQFVLDADGDGRITLPGEVGGGEINATAAVWCWPEDVEVGKQDGEPFAKSW